MSPLEARPLCAPSAKLVARNGAGTATPISMGSSSSDAPWFSRGTRPAGPYDFNGKVRVSGERLQVLKRSEFGMAIRAIEGISRNV